MLFLIEYDRIKGRLVELKKFDDMQQQAAKELRLQKELDLNRRGIDHEVVLLDATSEEALRKTHRRYFENLEELAKSA